MNCSQQCVGHCKDNATCNHVTGLCEKGCDAGWTGAKCQKGIYIPYVFNGCIYI